MIILCTIMYENEMVNLFAKVEFKFSKYDL
jgi:hypothetical protein